MPLSADGGNAPRTTEHRKGTTVHRTRTTCRCLDEEERPPREAYPSPSDVRLGLEDLLAVIHSLDEPSRARVAHALAETEMDARFKDLITHLAARAPAAVAGRRSLAVAAGRHPAAI